MGTMIPDRKVEKEKAKQQFVAFLKTFPSGLQNRYVSSTIAMQKHDSKNRFLTEPTTRTGNEFVQISDLPFAPPGTVEVAEIRCKMPFSDALMVNEDVAPIFIPSANRIGAEKSHRRLLEDLHEILENSDENLKQSLRIFVVVEPRSFQSYVKLFPKFNFLVLPSSSRGIAYSRFIIDRIIRVTLGGKDVPIIMADDNIFFGEFGERKNGNRKRIAKLVEEFQCLTDRMKKEIEQKSKVALMGCTKQSDLFDRKREELVDFSDSAFVYKVFCYRPSQTASKGVDFIPGLRCAEDIAFERCLRQKGLQVRKISSTFFDSSILKNGREKVSIFQPYNWLLQWRLNSSKPLTANEFRIMAELTLFARNCRFKACYAGACSAPLAAELLSEVFAQLADLETLDSLGILSETFIHQANGYLASMWEKLAKSLDTKGRATFSSRMGSLSALFHHVREERLLVQPETLINMLHKFPMLQFVFFGTFALASTFQEENCLKELRAALCGPLAENRNKKQAEDSRDDPMKELVKERLSQIKNITQLKSFVRNEAQNYPDLRERVNRFSKQDGIGSFSVWKPKDFTKAKFNVKLVLDEIFA